MKRRGDGGKKERGIVGWLRWFFVSPGVVATDAPPKVFLKLGRVRFCYNTKPFRGYWPNGPTSQFWSYYRGKLKFFHCKICGVGCWGYKQTTCCGSWKCFKEIQR